MAARASASVAPPELARRTSWLRFTPTRRSAFRAVASASGTTGRPSARRRRNSDTESPACDAASLIRSLSTDVTWNPTWTFGPSSGFLFGRPGLPRRRLVAGFSDGAERPTASGGLAWSGLGSASFTGEDPSAFFVEENLTCRKSLSPDSGPKLRARPRADQPPDRWLVLAPSDGSAAVQITMRRTAGKRDGPPDLLGDRSLRPSAS